MVSPEIDDYEERTNNQGYWQNSAEYLYVDLEKKWRDECFPGLELPDYVYKDKTLLLNNVSQNRIDWGTYVDVPRFKLASVDTMYESFQNAVLDWLHQIRKGTANLAFVGDGGTGKTYSALAAARFMTLHGVIRGKDVLYMPPSRMLDCADAHNRLDGWSKEQNANIEVARLQNIPLLVLADLGAAPTSAKAAIANIASICNHRYNYNLPTIVTSNLDVKDLVELYGSTTARRLISDGAIVHYS